MNFILIKNKVTDVGGLHEKNSNIIDFVYFINLCSCGYYLETDKNW